MSADKPYDISGNLTLLSPSYSILSNYLYDKQPTVEKDTILNQGKLQFTTV